MLVVAPVVLTLQGIRVFAPDGSYIPSSQHLRQTQNLWV
jgi:hypothetical protein